jgi:putative phage-type endonuclease
MSIQGTDEWKAERLGKVTASRIYDITARIKSGGFSSQRKAYATQLAIEKISNQPYTFQQSLAMQHGTATEPLARDAYRSTIFEEVVEVGFIDHPFILNAGASPDGLVGDDGLVEIKCPESHTHIGYLLEGVIPEKYAAQMQWQMACTGRKWCDFVSFDPRCPENLQIFIKRLPRDEVFIACTEEMIKTFLKEVDQLVDQLSNKIKENIGA